MPFFILLYYYSKIKLLDVGHIKDEDLYFRLHLTRGDCYMILNKYKEAYDDYMKIKPIWSQKNNLNCEEHHFIHRLGLISFRQEKYQQSKDYFKNSLQILETHCDTSHFTIFTRNKS